MLTIRHDQPLAPLTSFRLGGPARTLVEITTEQDARVAGAALGAGRRPHILGGGTNVLIADEGLELVWHLHPRQPLWQDRPADQIEVWAGNTLSSVAWRLIGLGRAGLERFAVLPGSVGGAVWNNVHTDDHLLAESLVSVRYLDLTTGQLQERPAAQLELGYDQSWFQTHPSLILTARFQVHSGQDPAQLRRVATDLLAAKRRHQPLGESSAGCFWQNLPNIPSLRAAYPQFAARATFPTGFLIQQLFPEPPSVGGAQVSSVHGCFIINTGHATSRDVRQLADQIQTRVASATGLQLQPEVTIWSER